jgi:hypothetical protein
MASVVGPWHFGTGPDSDSALFGISFQDVFCLLLLEGTFMYISLQS